MREVEEVWERGWLYHMREVEEVWERGWQGHMREVDEVWERGWQYHMLRRSGNEAGRATCVRLRNICSMPNWKPFVMHSLIPKILRTPPVSQKTVQKAWEQAKL